jgi:hypothetical protein
MAAEPTEPSHAWCLEHWRQSWVRVVSHAGKQVLRAKVAALCP